MPRSPALCSIARGLTLAAALISGACSSLRVRSDVNEGLLGTVQCHTFAWAGNFRGTSSLRSTLANPLNESRLRSAIASHLESVGVTAASGAADCLVGYGIGYRSVIEGAYPYWGYGWGWPGWWDGPYVYREGIIGVDLYDAKSHQPLWHASVEQSLAGLDGSKAEQKIQEAVTALFTKYPAARPAKPPAGAASDGGPVQKG